MMMMIIEKGEKSSKISIKLWHDDESNWTSCKANVSTRSTQLGTQLNLNQAGGAQFMLNSEVNFFKYWDNYEKQRFQLGGKFFAIQRALGSKVDDEGGQEEEERGEESFRSLIVSF